MSSLKQGRARTVHGSTVRDPTVQLTVFVRRELASDAQRAPAVAARRAIFELVRQFIVQCSEDLSAQDSVHNVVARPNDDWTQALANDDAMVDRLFVQISTDSPGEAALFSGHLQVTRPTSEPLELYRCRVDAFEDVTIVQLGACHYGEVASLTAGLHAVEEFLLSHVDVRCLEAASDATLGASMLYWAIAVEPFAAELDGDARCSEVRLNEASARLWQTDTPLFHDVASLPQDCWVLVTTGSDDVIALANGLYFDRGSGVAFNRMSLARQKFRFNHLQYVVSRRVMEHIQKSLDAWAESLLKSVAAGHQSESQILLSRSSDAETFQDELKAAAHELAQARAYVSEVKRLRRTLQLARHDFVVNSIPLLSLDGARQVVQSDAHEPAALRFLAEWQATHVETFFRAEVGRMQSVCDQVDADLDYAGWVIERNAASLQSATEQLQITSVRDLGEVNHHLALDSAAVVASLVAFVAVEAVIKPLALEATVFGLGSVLFVASLSFTVLVSFARGNYERGWLEMGSVWVTIAFGLITIGDLVLAWLHWVPFEPTVQAAGSPVLESPTELRMEYLLFGSAGGVIILALLGAEWLRRWRRRRRQTAARPSPLTHVR